MVTSRRAWWGHGVSIFRLFEEAHGMRCSSVDAGRASRKMDCAGSERMGENFKGWIMFYSRGRMR
jgi:hypothetical protein